METPPNNSKWKLWLKRAGMLGFLFFLIKGLAWIGVAIAVYFGLFNK
ncbi:MAG: hypothetical protein KIS94_04255 [Chitinophagales bacterium]|nr:hypothetical protein [Chitinophagales bacterium]